MFALVRRHENGSTAWTNERIDDISLPVTSAADVSVLKVSIQSGIENTRHRGDMGAH